MWLLVSSVFRRCFPNGVNDIRLGILLYSIEKGSILNYSAIMNQTLEALLEKRQIHRLTYPMFCMIADTRYFFHKKSEKKLIKEVEDWFRVRIDEDNNTVVAQPGTPELKEIK